MFRGITVELSAIASAIRMHNVYVASQNSLLQDLLSEQVLRRQRDGRRHRKENAKDAATYAAGLPKTSTEE